jgi:hypothetical protein
MSRLRVNEIINFDEDGAPVAVEGFTIASGKKFKILGERTIANSTDSGEQGEICWDAQYLYICVGTNAWKRVLLDTW